MTATPRDELSVVPEALISLAAPGEYVVSNPVVRTHAVADAEFVALLSELTVPRSRAELGDALGARTFRVVDASISPFVDGLLGDPTGVRRDASLASADELDLDAALALAQRLRLVVADPEAYERYLEPREHILDLAHLGNIHQRVAEYVLLELRQKNLDTWWTDQKFTADRREPRPGLYHDVQWRFAVSHYDRARLEGKRVLDFGCGPGLFSRLFALGGASVLGLDVNESHLETAQRCVDDEGLGSRVELRRLELPPERTLASMEDDRFDLIFLSDVLMFYFHAYDASARLDPVDLLRRLAALLAPGGTIDVLEPNGAFWQQPWLGSPTRPLTIVSEYRNRRHGVTPTLEELSVAAEGAGLAISRVRELVAEPGSTERGSAFAAEFPLWWFFELERRGGG